uniref:HDC13059 n=1 Tax=Drosophila melanogaster TaxID=7227 RepID=Q6IK99_DROME|nr:TPA_inf: HDC13059 [Drosophila melanogaster]
MAPELCIFPIHFESSRCVITTRQEAGCSGKVERELKPMVIEPQVIWTKRAGVRSHGYVPELHDERISSGNQKSEFASFSKIFIIAQSAKLCTGRRATLFSIPNCQSAKVKQARLESGSERDSPAISSLAPLRVFPPPSPSPSKTSRPSLSAQAWPIQ